MITLIGGPMIPVHGRSDMPAIQRRAARLWTPVVIGFLLLAVLTSIPGESGPSERASVANTPALSSVIFSTSTALTSNVFAANITIDPGVTLTTNGFSLVAAGTFDNLGSMVTGPSSGTSYPDSYGGSGGGADSATYCSTAEDGYATEVPGGAVSCANTTNGGPGSTPTPPNLNSSLVANWFGTGIQSYLSGASGGGIGGTDLSQGGPGAHGVYVQASTLVAGAIGAAGGPGSGTCSGIGLTGGGGGGTILLAFGAGGLMAGTYNVAGGAEALTCDGTHWSGHGGSGQTLTLSYGSSPPVPVNGGPPVLGSITFTFSTNLTSEILADNVTVDPGVMLTTNGFGVIASNLFDNEGTVVGGVAPLNEYPDSFGGSGGGSSSATYCADTEDGFSTSAPGGSATCSANGGSGSTPISPTVTPALVATWNASGTANYLSGARGGAIIGAFPGGAGAAGVFIEASTLVAGDIAAQGQPGTGTCSAIGLSGGGGGAAVLLVYGQGGLTSGDYNVSGGAGAGSCDGLVSSGSGGSGQVLTLESNGSSPGTGGTGPNHSPSGTRGEFLGLSDVEWYIVLAVVALGASAAAAVTFHSRRHRTSPPK